MTTSEAPARRRCSCGRMLTPLANGTVPRHTAPFKKDSQTLDYRPYKRTRCHGTGKVFPAIARQRSLQRSLSAVHDGFDAAAKRMNERAARRYLAEVMA